MYIEGCPRFDLLVYLYLEAKVASGGSYSTPSLIRVFDIIRRVPRNIYTEDTPISGF